MERIDINHDYPIRTCTAEQWAAFTDKQRWDVMSALRGPDFRGEGSAMLKNLTTAVIRGVVAPILRTRPISAVVCTRPRMVVMPHPSMWFDFDDGFSVGHFFSHIRDAAQVLGIPCVDVPRDQYIRSLPGTPSAVCEMIKDPIARVAFADQLSWWYGPFTQ